jgi:hypothetical protein
MSRWDEFTMASTCMRAGKKKVRLIALMENSGASLIGICYVQIRNMLAFIPSKLMKSSIISNYVWKCLFLVVTETSELWQEHPHSSTTELCMQRSKKHHHTAEIAESNASQPQTFEATPCICTYYRRKHYHAVAHGCQKTPVATAPTAISAALDVNHISLYGYNSK